MQSQMKHIYRSLNRLKMLQFMSCALTKCALLKEHSRRKRNGLSKLWEKTHLNCVAVCTIEQMQFH